MKELRTSTAPAWSRPGAAWTAKLCWPALFVGIGLLVWRIVDGDSVVHIAFSALFVLVLALVLIGNRSARERARRRSS
ncbi:hypothetical protein ACN2WE_01210 [Streptomyces sp. cg28]|uniref:hypothetical protein n=1 Tax=Streptomyces sp. cg28 TaxID=3403457 RepID=UPI003B227905